MQRAYAAIGRAVFAAQVFESVLVVVFEIFKMKSDPAYLGKTGGYIPAGAFKVPVKSIVNALAAKGIIASDLEERLSQFAEDRNTLIHRWVQEHGWPDDDEDGFRPIIELAGRVELEARQLASSFAGYMVKFANPQWASEHGEDYEEHVAKLFHRVHIDG